jgi:hypothetical protein
MEDVKAFPTADSRMIDPQFGMDLRDYFAAKAMQSLILTANLDATKQHKSDHENDIFEISDTAYKIADEMIERR